MKKQNKPSPSLGKHHQASLVRNAYDKGPKPGVGHYPSLGSAGKPGPVKKGERS